jgi:hypothetical protein
MSFVSNRLDFSELKNVYIGGIVGGIIGGWILLTIGGTVLMPAVAQVNFLDMLGAAMGTDSTMTLMFHLMMSIVYGLVFAFLVGNTLNGSTKLFLYGLIYGLILMIPLILAMVMFNQDVVAIMTNIPLIMMIMVNHALYGLGVGAGVYLLTK